MNGLRKLFVCYLVFSFLCLNAAWADEGMDREGESQMLRQEIQLLKQRLMDLERRLEQTERQVVVKPVPPLPAPIPSGFPEGLAGLEISGFVDTSYVYNIDQPGNRTNSLRAFDRDANGFSPHLFQLSIEKPVTEESRVGFRTDLDFGEDAEQIGSTGLGTTDDEFDLQQAYVTALLPVGNGLEAKFGKFVTLLGGEVIESKDNWNFSRSFLFFYAINFTNTGLRLSYPVSDNLSATIGVNNGWDIVDDNNHGKTFESQISYTPYENFSITVSNIIGPEQADRSDNMRDVVDGIISYSPTDKLSLMVNADYGFEEDGVRVGTDAEWYGIAGYARYQWLDWWAIALRGEYFDDNDGTRTGNVQELWEITATNEFNVYKDLIARLEYRHDDADRNSFKNSTEDTQDTFAVEFIYPF